MRRSMTREERKLQRMDAILTAFFVLGVMFCVISALSLIGQIKSARAAIESADRTLAASRARREAVTIMLEPYEGEAEDEAERITAALVENGYFSDAIPLSYELQDVLRTACSEFDVPYHLALAVMEQETNFRMVDGDGGDSIGFFQIQPRWWNGLAEEIGADLYDPVGNIRTGCAVIRNLLNQTGDDIEAALGKYNKRPTYPAEVISRMERWEEVVTI